MNSNNKATTKSQKPSSSSTIGLPNVEWTFREPELAGWANLILGTEKYSRSEMHDHPAGRGHVYLGPQQAAGERKLIDLQKTDPPITGIVNCTNRFPNHHEQSGIEYCSVPVNDENGANLLIYMEGASQFINRHVSSGGSVLVHCQMGISRSSSIVCAYLIRYHGYSRDEAFVTVKSRRPKTNPNAGFWTQLYTFEKRCRKRKIKAYDDSFPSISIRGVDLSKEWAQQSLATFQTVGHLLDDPNECFSELSSHSPAAEIVFIALDYIWGRGILDADLPWLSALCRSLSPRDAVGMVVSLLAEGSDFAELWSGEIYERDVLRVTRFLAKDNPDTK
eukprot:CAMPEP_0195509238 /NCGR_PEP_ID=MMETSP0794_2-20130614/2229_1 /TAXON_ID=515487 /ORGANISM="Stephanopyxis turris, Strain CCMP 815" /LENGTH=333 /DNA_ID=CAMNT_0040636403 /DNA_START=45 /DNA_END=1046 /DNA_ORIENTATION=+